jgi:hypothetical protein
MALYTDPGRPVQDCISTMAHCKFISTAKTAFVGFRKPAEARKSGPAGGPP